MRIGLLAIVVLIALGVVSLAAWALVRFAKNRADRRASSDPAIVVLACCTALWLGLCFPFMLLASLGHSSHPLRDSWPECVVSFLILVATPLSIVIWLSKRKKR
jgi:cytochrome bd-type quinol oxidase subunit 2